MALLKIECCLTDYLLEEVKHFEYLAMEKRKLIIDMGRSTPFMKIDFRRKDGFVTHFNMSVYTRYCWLTGSCKLNRMYCFPCMLFGKSPPCSWSVHGYGDINNLVNNSKKHIRMEKHIRSCLSLLEFGANRIEAPIDSSLLEHNRKVEKNRKIMERLIDTVVLLGKQELSFQGNDQNSDGNYVETILYLSKYDTLLESHFEQCSSAQIPISSGLSSEIQNKLILSVAEVVKSEIKLEISKSQGVTIIIDETLDLNPKGHLSVILRYLCEDVIEERFICFIEGCSSGEELSKRICDIIDEYACKEKLIGQSYGSLALKCDELETVIKNILEFCPMANFIPSYAHVLNSIFFRSLERIPELRMFFANVYSIVDFFCKSSKRSDLLQEIVNQRTMGVSDIDWNDRPRVMYAILNNSFDIIKAFNHIIDDLEGWDTESLSLAESLLIKVEDNDFIFLLNAFSLLFAKTEVLFETLMNEITHVAVVKKEVETFESWFCCEFSNKFDSIFDSLNYSGEPPRKRQRSFEIHSKIYFRGLFDLIKDNILSQLKIRYNYFTELIFLDLLNKSEYTKFAKTSPEVKILCLKNHYPGIFDILSLKNELKVLYTTPSLKDFDILSLHKHLRKELLRDTFPQVIALSSIFSTLSLNIPACTTEGSHSVQKRIEMYLSNCREENRGNSDLAILSIEKRLLLKIKSRNGFFNMVLAEFIKKDQTIALEYC